MARLKAVLDLVEAAITNVVPATTYATGHKFLSTKNTGYRIVWVPGTDKYDAPRDGRQTRPRSVRTRQAHFSAVVSGPDFGLVEDLVNATVLSMHAIAHGSMDVGEGEWSQPDWLDNGHVCTLSFSLALPVTAAMPTLGHASPAFDTSSTVQGDGFLDAGEAT